MFTQFLSQVLTKIGHVGKGKRMLLPEPFPDLLAAKAFFANGFHPLMEILETELAYVAGFLCWLHRT